ncbi:phospholipase A2 inhibitor and Ly6/PLAUR domain-containing protein-like [Anomaloglossus baeobatrachus]|uniref:phospholipase A2 inhibitor and Ly6/PLAUR domain-containing protein-like n=1 Tax=Anomaloglossus baeobatrachus TaxID=238106 RepID=UPI003F4FF3EB
MKNLATLLYIISALVISVFSYKCYSCCSYNSTTCNVSETECLGDRCMAAFQDFKIEGNEFKSILKGCANETMCGINGSATAKNSKFLFESHCCKGHLCNNQTYETPEDNLTTNGVTCPLSMCPGTLEDCKSEKEVNCTGSMDRCVDYRGTLKDPNGRESNYSAKGCTNSVACKYNFDSQILTEEIHRVFLKC